MNKFTALLLSGSLFCAAIPTGFAATNQGAAAITDLCKGYTGQEQGQCLRRELRQRTLERRSSRRLQRSLRLREQDAADGTMGLPQNTNVRATIKNIPTRRSQLEAFKERAEERLRLRLQSMQDDEDTTEDEDMDETEDEVTTSPANSYLHGKTRARFRRYMFMRANEEDAEDEDMDEEEETESDGE